MFESIEMENFLKPYLNVKTFLMERLDRMVFFRHNKLPFWIYYSCMIMILVLNTSDSFAQAESVIGSFRIDVVQSIELMEEGTKARYDSLPIEIKSRITDSMETRRFVFHENGQLQVNWGTPPSSSHLSGAWTLQRAGINKLVLDVGGDHKEYLVADESENHLLLTNTEGTGLFNNLLLVRID